VRFLGGAVALLDGVRVDGVGRGVRCGGGRASLGGGCVSKRDSFGYARSDVLFDVSIYVLPIVDEAILGGENGRLRYGVIGRVWCVDGWLWDEVVGKSVIRVDAGEMASGR